MNVLDASVVIKAVVGDEVDYDIATDMIRRGGIVPEWMFAEVANAIATKTRYTEKEAKELLDLVYNMGFQVEKVDRGLIEKAMVLAKQLKVSVYDTIYVVLAQKRKVDLVTADKKFVDKVNWSFVKLLK